MEHKNKPPLPFKTALQSYQALRLRINTGELPECFDSIINALYFYKEYFMHYKEHGTSKEQCHAEECLTSISIMIATLAWREARARAVFYSDL